MATRSAGVTDTSSTSAMPTTENAFTDAESDAASLLSTVVVVEFVGAMTVSMQSPVCPTRASKISCNNAGTDIARE